MFLAALIGYSGGEEIPNVPKPDAGLCGVTKETYDTVPGSGALLDINVDVTWDDSTVWIGIISVEDYESLEKLGGNSDGEIVSCDARIEYVAGGPSSGETSSFSYTPDGEDFHIMIGSLEEADDDDDDDGGGDHGHLRANSNHNHSLTNSMLMLILSVRRMGTLLILFISNLF